jgi:glucosamine-6-phosphate deaminase
MSSFDYQLSKHLVFRDAEACRKARSVRREDITRHPNPNFKIRVIENEQAFGFAWVTSIVSGIKRALDEGRDRYVIILPAPSPAYAMVAHMINELNIPCHHVHTFNMDEYANDEGVTAPADWKGGFQYWMRRDLFGRIKPELRMPDSHINFPSTSNVNDYSKMIEDLGGADVCYGGVGWCGHIAFFEPYLGIGYEDRIDEYLELGSRMVDLSMITICQNSLYADGFGAGDWSWGPSKAATIGPRDLKNSKLVSFWDGYGCGDSYWQKFISRLAAHGPVTPLVPASILQILRSELVLSGPVASDCVTQTCERSVAFDF